MAVFACVAKFKSGVEPQDQHLLEDFNSHLMQPVLHIKLWGMLLDHSGRRAGILLLIESDDKSNVLEFLNISPFAKVGMYEDVSCYEYSIEGGRLP